MTSTHPNLADLDALAAEEPFVRALARSLLGGDAAAADDVVQQTWLEVVRRGAPAGAARRGWLARVVRSRASNLRRGEARRTEHERAAARAEAVLDPAELLARAEQRRRVVEVVAALPEPYRTAILLRYLEGLEPAAIADRLGVARATVATRLKRALAMLRTRFDADHGGDRAAWMGALAPLALPVRAPANAVAAKLAGIWASLSAVKPVLVVLGVMLAIGWLVRTSTWTPHAPEPMPPVVGGDAKSMSHVADAQAGSVQDAAPERRQVAVVGPERARTATVADPLAVAAARVVGRAVLPGGAPAAGRACRLWAIDPLVGLGGVHDPLGPPQDAGPTWTDATTDEQGRFAFLRVPPGQLHALWLAHDSVHATWRSLPRTPGPQEQVDVGTIELDTAATIEGIVVDAAGDPVAGAEVWAADVPSPVLAALPIHRIEPEGALLVGLPEAGAQDAVGWARALRSHLGSWVPQAPADARFQVLPFPGWVGRAWRALPIPRARTGPDGRFSLRGVAHGDNVLVATAEGHETAVRPRVVARRGETADVGRVRLRDGEPLTCVVRAADGTAVPGAEVRVAMRPRIGINGILFASAAKITDAGGQVRFEGLPRGEFIAAYRGAAGDGWTTSDLLGAGEAVDLVLPAARDVIVTVRGATGVPEDVAVRVWQGPPFGEATATGWNLPLDETRHVEKIAVDGDAERIMLHALTPGLHTLQVVAVGQAIETRTFEVGEDGESELEVVLRPAVTCAIEVVDGAQRPVAGAEVWLMSSDAGTEAWSSSLLQEYGSLGRFRYMPRRVGTTDAGGRIVAHHVPSAAATVIARDPRFGLSAVAVRAPEDGVRVVLESPGALAGRLMENGSPAPVGRFELVVSRVSVRAAGGLPQLEQRVLPAADGSFRLAGLVPGEYSVAAVRLADGGAPRSVGTLLTAMTPEWTFGGEGSVTRRVTVRPNATAELVFDADPLAPDAGGLAAPLRVRVALGGQPVVGARVFARPAGHGMFADDVRLGETDAEGRVVRAEPTARAEGGILGVGVVDETGEVAMEWTWCRALDGAAGEEVAFAADAAELELRVVGFDALPATGHEVRLHGTPSTGGAFDATTATGAEGIARIRVPAGRYTIRISGSRGAGEVAGIEARGSQRREVKLGAAGVVAGRVVVPDGETLTHVLLAPADRSRFWMQRVSDGDRFAMSDVPPGTYELQIRTSKGLFDADPHHLEVGPDGAIGLTVRIGPRDD